MDIVRSAQERLGHVSEETIGLIADALSIQRVEVRDMVSFYAFLSRQPKGKTIIRLCNAVVERMKGADLVAKAFEKAVGVSFGETTPDGAISLEYTPCIGMSDQAPSALVGKFPITNLKPADVPKIVEAIRKGEDPAKLPNAGVCAGLIGPGPVVFAPFERGVGIRAAVALAPEKVIEQVKKSSLRGRGGAGFPTGLKWEFCRKAKGGVRYVICNADEGEPGTFKDRAILTVAPDMLFEGMTIAGYAMGAKEGILYLRAEYEFLRGKLEEVLNERDLQAR